MSVTPVRQGSHSCELPAEDDRDYKDGDIVRCDTCRRAWQMERPRGHYSGRWYRVSRLTAWWAARQQRKAPPVDDRPLCGSCHLPVDHDVEWCPRCTKCPEHGNLCFPGLSYDCPNAAKPDPRNAS